MKLFSWLNDLLSFLFFYFVKKNWTFCSMFGKIWKYRQERKSKYPEYKNWKILKKLKKLKKNDLT